MFQKAHQIGKSAFVAFCPACCQILPEKKPPLIWMSLRGAVMAFAAAWTALNFSITDFYFSLLDGELHLIDLYFHLSLCWEERAFSPVWRTSDECILLFFFLPLLLREQKGDECRKEDELEDFCWWIFICTVKFLWWKIVSFFIVCAMLCAFSLQAALCYVPVETTTTSY